MDVIKFRKDWYLMYAMQICEGHLVSIVVKNVVCCYCVQKFGQNNGGTPDYRKQGGHQMIKL
jgi:hypothetical protein